MSRLYYASFANVSVAAVQELFSLAAGNSMAFKLHRVSLSQASGTAQSLQVSLRYISSWQPPGDNGSGGTALTPVRTVESGVNPYPATVQVRCNDTTRNDLGLGTAMAQYAWNTEADFDFWPHPEARPECLPSKGFVLSLDSAPAGGTPVFLTGTVVFEELF